MSVNKVILMGNLGADPEIRDFQNGGKVANLRVATSDRWKDRETGEQKEKTEWHSVAIFSGTNRSALIDYIQANCRKGTKVYVEGKLATRKWQDQNGQDRYTTEVVIDGFNGQFENLSAGGGAAGDGHATGQNQGGQ